MNNRDLEQKIMSSYRNIAPDILDSVLANCDTQKGQIISMQNKKKKSTLLKSIGGLAAALLLVLGGLGIYRGSYAVASTVMLDVNPGIGISVNKNEKVLDVKPYNPDAEIVIGNMDFSGSSLDVAVNALIGSMLRNGYISQDANSILVSVDSVDPVAGQAMQTRLMDEISGIMKSGNVSGAVLGQTVKDDAALTKLAEQYGITTGKAKLIQQITSQNTLYTFADLVPLTINELNLISESGGTKLENIESIGTASSSAYIGEQAATEAALAHVQLRADQTMRLHCELDWERGAMVYEVDIDADGYEHEVDIDASTGEVLYYNREKDDDYFYAPVTPASPAGQSAQPTQPVPSASPAASSYVGEDAAKEAAFLHAGVKESDVVYCVCEPDHKRGIRTYEVDFVANGYEYEYDINAETGEVIKFSREWDDGHHNWTTAQPLPTTRNTDDIGEAAAKQAALDHAGVSDIWDYEWEFDYERGVGVYEISFVSGGYEYEYKIAAADGSVLKFERERD